MSSHAKLLSMMIVTLRMEGVDRNSYNTYRVMRYADVTLRMEGVDRNHVHDEVVIECTPSPSAWRVWIEILTSWAQSTTSGVTLRMEGI